MNNAGKAAMQHFDKLVSELGDAPISYTILSADSQT
jgi:hypothetical protein